MESDKANIQLRIYNAIIREQLSKNKTQAAATSIARKTTYGTYDSQLRLVKDLTTAQDLASSLYRRNRIERKLNNLFLYVDYKNNAGVPEMQSKIQKHGVRQALDAERQVRHQLDQNLNDLARRRDDIVDAWVQNAKADDMKTQSAR